MAKNPIPHEPANARLTRERVLVLVLGIVTGLVCVLGFRLAQPFVPAITWAVVLAVIAHPLHEAILRRLHRPWLAAALAVLAVTIVLALPTSFVVQQIAQETLASTETARSLLDGDRWKSMLDRVPRLGPLRRWIEAQVDLRAEFAHWSEEAAKSVREFLAGSLQFAVGILITLFLLFYFLRDKRKLLDGLRGFVPLAPSEADKVMRKISDTIHAIVYGTLTVAVVQGTLGGLMFWWLGIPAPLLWGAVMTLLAVLPVLGAAIIWVPVALYLAAQGDWEKALVLAAWGAIVISLIDNVLYPVLVKDRLRVHTVPVFIAVLGGLVVFGATGIVLGPLVLAVAIALIEIWRQRMAQGEIESGVDRQR